MSETTPGTANNAPGQPLSRALRELIVRAVAEAQHRNAPLVEAEHLLLALTMADDSPVRAVLADAGLDTAGVDAALSAERAASLRVAGVEPLPASRLVASPRVARPRWGASAKDALVRAHKAAAAQRRQRSAEIDLLAGLFALELGTVPRALTLAGVDRPALLAAARRAA
ncbi:MAG: Clp protease N-terminal domain-containing protein [Leifsonia sp.]|uniref:Clp protease N-terminal domain-containing protein n=1 Tax=Leifsonia sp. TaxID=1870902 RepID=UPI003F810EF4